MGHGGTGKKVRPLVSCKGTVCVHGLYDTQKLVVSFMINTLDMNYHQNLK